MFWVEFAVFLLAIYIGIRVGGIGLGLIGGTGVTVFTFAFGMKPGGPPIDVMLIILAVVAASATLHAAGGLTYMVQLAEKLLRKHPRNIVFLAPYCTYFLTMAVGPAMPSTCCSPSSPTWLTRREYARNAPRLSLPSSRKWGSRQAPSPRL